MKGNYSFKYFKTADLLFTKENRKVETNERGDQKKNKKERKK